MHKQTLARSVLFKGIQRKLWVALFVFACLFSAVGPLLGRSAEAATSSTINFQARLLQSNGVVVADGYYNVEFKLYNVSTSGTALWTETRYDSNGVTAGSDNRVRVVNGYLTANLGSVTAFPTINWDQELWLTMNIGGTTQTASPTWDGEMNPRLKFTASPYAFAAGKLQTTSGANTSTLGFASQTASRSLLLPDESGTLCVQSSTACGFAASSGSGSYIQNGTTPQVANFNITGAGTLDILTVGSAVALGNAASPLNTGAGRAALHVSQAYSSLAGISAATGTVSNIGVSTNTDNATDIAAYSGYVTTDGSADYNGLVYGSKNLVSHNGSGAVTNAVGNDSAVYVQNGGTIADGVANQGIVAAIDGTIINATAFFGGAIALDGSMSEAKGLVSYVSNFGTGTIDNGYGVYVNQALNLGGGNFDNNYGIYIEDQSVTGSINSYNLYSAGATAKNLIEGSLQVGSTTTGARVNIGTNSDTAASAGIAFGTDTNLYRAGANLLATDDAFQSTNYISAYNGGANQVTLGRTAVGVAGAGIVFGSAQDTNLYRSAADTLKTDDNLVVAGALNVTSTSNSYIMGALGLGTASPQTGSALTVANGAWMSSLDAAGTGYINLFQVNAANEIQVGAAMNVDGGIILPTNGGQLTLVDLPIDTTSTAGTVHGYTMRVGTTNALTVYGQSDGAGGAQNVRVAIGSSITPAYALDVTGDINSTTGYRISGVAVCTASGCSPAAGSASYIQNGTSQQASSNFNISGAGVVGTTLAVNGNTLSTTSATMSLFNTGATTLNLAGAATTITVGAASGTANFNGRVNVGGSVSARLAVTATNNNEPALYVRTTNAANYGNALQITNGTTDYLTIGAYGAVTFNLANSANVAQAYRFNTGPNGAGILLDMNAQQQSVGIAKAASSSYTLDVNGSTNATNYYRSGVLLNSSHLSDYSSLARLNTTNTLTSSSAFIVTNGGGTNAFMVDTNNGRVGIGTTGAPGNYALDVAGIFQVDKPNNRLIVGTWGGDTSGTLMVLGNKTTTSDPTGVAGAMYYNSFHRSFRCYTNSLWQDCGPQTKKMTSIDGTQGSSFYSIEELRFNIRPNTDYAIKCSLLYQSSLASSGAIFSLGGDGAPSSLIGMVSTFSTTTSTPAGYMFSVFDGGSGTSDVPGDFTDTPATLDATYTSGSTASTLVLRIKPELSTETLALYPGSYCQLTKL